MLNVFTRTDRDKDGKKIWWLWFIKADGEHCRKSAMTSDVHEAIEKLRRYSRRRVKGSGNKKYLNLKRYKVWIGAGKRGDLLQQMKELSFFNSFHLKSLKWRIGKIIENPKDKEHVKYIYEVLKDATDLNRDLQEVIWHYIKTTSKKDAVAVFKKF